LCAERGSKEIFHLYGREDDKLVSIRASGSKEKFIPPQQGRKSRRQHKVEQKGNGYGVEKRRFALSVFEIV
jgi:hypothetical protein